MRSVVNSVRFRGGRGWFFIQALVGGPVPLEPVVLAQRLEEPKVLQKSGREGWKLMPTPLVGDMRREKAEEGEMEAEERQSRLDRFSKQVFRFRRNSHPFGRPGPWFQGVQSASYHVRRFNLCLTI